MTDLVFLTEAEARRRTEAESYGMYYTPKEIDPALGSGAFVRRQFVIDHRGPGDYAVTDAQHGDRVVASADSLPDAQLLAAAHERVAREPQYAMSPPSLGTLTGADYAAAQNAEEPGLPEGFVDGDWDGHG